MKTKVLYIAIVVIMLTCLVLGLSYGYFSANVIRSEEKENTVSTGTLNLNVSDSSVNLNNLMPIYDENYETQAYKKVFTINNTGNLNSCSTIKLNINSISEGLKSRFLKYKLVSSSGSESEGNFTSIDEEDNIILMFSEYIASSTSRTYTLYIWISYSDTVDQMNMLGTSLNAKISVKSYDARTSKSCRIDLPSTTSYLDKTKFQNFVTNNSPTEIYFTITGSNTGTDISNDPTEPIYAWMEGTKMYVSAREPNKKVSAPVDSSYLFSGNYCSKLKDVEKMDVEHLNTKNVTNMSNMFYMSGYNATTWDIGDLSSWDTSKVTNMSGMFYYAGYKVATFELDLSNWDTSKVTSMYYMFFKAGYNATTFNLDLSNWNTSQVTDMSSMFDNAGYKATTWNIGDLSNWDTSKVTNMSGMFYYAGCKVATFELDLSNWNTSQVTDMSSMFRYAGYNSTTWSIGNLSNWDTSQVTNMSNMFSLAGNYATTFELDLSNWNTSSVTNMSNMFNHTGEKTTTFEIKIPKRSNGTTDNTSSTFRGLGVIATPPSGKSFTLIN